MQLFHTCKFNPPSLGFATSCRKYDPGNRANINVERAGIFRDMSKSVVASRTISPIFRSLAGNNWGNETSTNHILAGQDGTEDHLPLDARFRAGTPSCRQALADGRESSPYRHTSGVGSERSACQICRTARHLLRCRITDRESE